VFVLESRFQDGSSKFQQSVDFKNKFTVIQFYVFILKKVCLSDILPAAENLLVTSSSMIT